MPRPVARLALAALALTGSLSAQAKPYATVIPASATTTRGLFDVHRVDAKLFFEIPDSLLGREMIIMSRYAQVQDGMSQVGANMAPNIVVRWERRDDRIHLRAVSHQTTADSGTARHIAVEDQNFAPVLASMAIAARGGANSVIDVSDLYLGEHPAFTLQRAQRTQLAVRRYERDRSWLEFARSFPTNVELRVVQSYAADQPPSNARGGAVSFEVNHSMIILPQCRCGRASGTSASASSACSAPTIRVTSRACGPSAMRGASAWSRRTPLPSCAVSWSSR
jgi:hypothetical protein